MRRRFVIFVASVVLLSAAIPALAQFRRIQGKVVDEDGKPVLGAVIEVVLVSLADAAFAVRNNDQTWRGQTNASGDYIVTVPAAGRYLVTATKAGVGSDQTKVAVTQSGLVTANLTLWSSRRPPSPIAKNCGTNEPIGAYKQSPLAAGANAGLARLLAWLEAVHLHTPGCSDPAVAEVARLLPRDLDVLLRDVRELVTFLQRAEDGRAQFGGRGGAQSDQLIFFIYDRRLTVDELRRQFFGNRPLTPNDLLLRAAVMHADAAIFVPGDLGRYPLVEDGGRRGWRGGSPQWETGRRLLDHITPAASDAAQLWYRAVSAHLFTAGNLAELSAHLIRARQVFPRNADILFDSARFHQELSSPAIQASVQQLRANDVNVTVGSRADELQRAERFFRDGLAVAPADADARMRLGRALGEIGRHAEAAAELRRVIDAKPDRQRLYFASLFLGREEEALGRNADARRRYEQAADLYPNAQSPRLALSRLAQQTGDRAAAQRSLINLASMAGDASSDPWWEFYEPHNEDADVLMDQMRQMGR